jgi:hypothetical protein
MGLKGDDLSLGEMRSELDRMRSELNEIDPNKKEADGDPVGAASDPLTEDHRTADSGRGLTKRVNEVIDDLEWRQIARDKQARAIEIGEDLEKSPAAVRAGWKARAQKRNHKPPESARGAKQLLGRLLLRCETLIDDVLGDTRETSRFGLATQLVNAAASLARTMDRIGSDPRQTRHTVKVEREERGE